MFSHHTILAIAALASIDTGVTSKERDALSELLSGRESVRFEPSKPFFTYERAARELGVSVPTVKRHVKKGSLLKVMGAGTRAIGVTPSSVRKLRTVYFDNA